jgi:hypothetical protein
MFTPVHSLVFYIVRYSVSSIIRTCVPPYTTLQQEHARAPDGGCDAALSRFRSSASGTLATSIPHPGTHHACGDGTATGHARPRTAREASRRDVDDEPLARIDQADHRLHHSVRSPSRPLPVPSRELNANPSRRATPTAHAHGPRGAPLAAGLARDTHSTHHTAAGTQTQCHTHHRHRHTTHSNQHNLRTYMLESEEPLGRTVFDTRHNAKIHRCCSRRLNCRVYHSGPQRDARRFMHASPSRGSRRFS